MSVLSRLISGTVAVIGSVVMAASAAAAPNLFEKASSAPIASPSSALGNKSPVKVDIVANKTNGTPRSDYQVGIRLQHEPGWYTYWRFAGDTGYPTTVDWSLPKNWSVTALGTPLPQRDSKGGLTNFILTGTTLLPFKLDIPWGTPYGTHGTIRAKVEWLACKDLCVPGEATVRFRVPVRVSGEPSQHAALFETTKKLIPEVVDTKSIQAVADETRLRIDLDPMAGKIARSVEFFPTKDEVINLKVKPVQTTREDGVTSLFLATDEAFAKQPDRTISGVFVADGGPSKGGWAIETSIPVVAGSVVVPESKPKVTPALPSATQTLSADPAFSTWSAMLFALLGGMILNLMPCVFPVLSLKILQLVDTQKRRGSLFLHGLAFTGGVLASMLALAGTLIALREIGWAVGWGFQLQTPWVVAGLSMLFIALALNLFGVFEFTFGTGLADTRAVNTLPTKGPAGSFWTGMLAVVVASPCTAPFMGAALGYAITQSAVESLSVFLALGLGMALPWLLLTLVPFWVKWLPKPGMWMVHFKRVMAVPMLLAAFWLVWVLSRQIDVFGLLSVLLGIGTGSIVLWLIGREQFGLQICRMLKYSCAIVTVTCLGLIGLGLFDQQSVVSDEEWKPWSEEAVTQALQDGHPVVVDFTAAWCVTCQFNKLNALRTESATRVMDDLGYKRFSADWTNRDESITKMLNAFGRTGVPLYLVYDKTGVPTVLPELLTEDQFIEALKRNTTQR